MKTHTITLEEVQEFLNSQDITIARSNRERKRLSVDLHGNLEVTVAGKEVYRGLQPSDAVRAYNKVTEKYKAPDFKL